MPKCVQELMTICVNPKFMLFIPCIGISNLLQ